MRTLLSFSYLKAFSSDLSTTVPGKIRFVRDKTKEFRSRLLTALTTEITETNESYISFSLLKAPPHQCRNLDNAVTVLRMISYYSNRQTLSYRKPELDNIIGDKFQSVLLCFQSQAGSSIKVNKRGGFNNTRNGRNNRRNGSLNSGRG